MTDLNARLRQIPPVNTVLDHPDLAPLLAEQPRVEIVSAVRRALDIVREEVVGGAGTPSAKDIADLAIEEYHVAQRAGLCRVVNATGIVLHTGLGRAVLPQQALEALFAEASGYCLLALDADSNERGRRERFCEALLKELTGCESATIVNNNAAAVLLMLNTLAEGREVIISRGQLVEIGGSYRMPDVMDQSGCKMVEVGCTNRTHLKDYADAITEDTAAIIRVHPSNYRVQGFTKEVPLEEMCALGKEHGIPVIDDLGSGAILELGGPFDEPTVTDSLRAGADLVSCSADKLIGGPQGGVILGSWDLVRKCERNQMSRALRVGKLDLVALEATLRLFRDRETLQREHPTTRMLTESAATVGKRADGLCIQILNAAPELKPRVVDGESYAGSGALPIKSIPSRVIEMDPPAGVEAGELARRLRTGEVPVFVRVHADRVYVDPRTVQPLEGEILVQALAEALGG